MFPKVGKQGNIDRKHCVSGTMFPSFPRILMGEVAEHIALLIRPVGSSLFGHTIVIFKMSCIFFLLFSSDSDQRGSPERNGRKEKSSKQE